MADPSPFPSNQYRWQIWTGLILVTIILLVGFLGANFAPRDPLQENFVVFMDDTTFVKPPFKAFLVPGFPLGSDEFGRDIFSRLLWGIKPTLILILVVASLRLFTGALIGMIAGWASPQQARWLNGLIAATGILPVLFVSLCVIAATGQKLGIWAFIIGLLVTGWGDVARLVREQTRIIKSNLYIEAAQALGASRLQMLANHVLPQVSSLIWMILAFEISSTTLITAELGVLGYFINAIWIPIGDWVGLRTSGVPELGQMLGDLQKQPWGALGAGLIIFTTILGFNLLGEGLRQWSSPEFARRRKSKVGLQINTWIDDQFFSQQSTLRRLGPTILGVILIVAIVVSGSIYLWQTQTLDTIKKIPPLPGGNLWSSSFRDSQGTLWVPFKAPQKPQLSWSLQLSAGISGSPVIDARGQLYLATMDAKLHSVSPRGELLWSINLPKPPLGTPALTATGDIYIADIEGGLTQVKADKSVKTIVKGLSPKSPALTGPLPGSENSIYFATTDYFFGISPDGTVKWKKPLPTYSLTSPIIRLTSDDKHLVFEDFVIRTDSGDLVNKGTRDPMDRMIIGSDLKIYILTQNYLESFNPDSASDEPKRTRWDSRSMGTGARFPYNSGVTPDGNIWLQFSSPFDFTRIIWLDKNGVSLNIIDYPYRGNLTLMAAIDINNSVIACGTTQNSPDRSDGGCRMTFINSSSPSWEFIFKGNPVGGALIESKLYITTGTGILYAFEDLR